MAEYIIDKIEYGGNVYKLQDSVSDFLTGAVTALSTTEGQHSTITNQNGAVSIAIPTKTSHLTNDSGFITSFTDEKVTNTALTAATTYYLTGSTNSSTETSGLSKHAAIKAYVTANNGTGGSARIDLGNTTATTSAGGKEGVIRLYGTSATYYVELKAGAPSANRTISFPNKAGTVALTSDIPTVSYPVTSVNNKTGAVSLSASDVGALPSSTAIPANTSDLTNDSDFVSDASYVHTDNNYTSTEKSKLSGIAAGAEVNVQSDWNATSGDALILNKPTIPTVPTNVSAFTNDAGYLTSHQSIKTINSTSMVGTGDVTVQPTLVSGTNIKTVNNNSLLGSGNIDIQSGSDISVTQVQIAVADWSGSTTVTCTKSVTGVTASNSVIVSPDPSSISDYTSSGVYCSAQGAGTLTFTCSSAPTVVLIVNVMIVG